VENMEDVTLSEGIIAKANEQIALILSDTPQKKVARNRTTS